MSADVAIAPKLDTLSLIKLADDLDHVAGRLSGCVATGVGAEARDEAERCLYDLRTVCSSLRGVALCLDSVLAESPSERRDAFRAIVSSFGEKVRKTTGAAQATVERMNGQMKHLDAIVKLDPREPVAARLQDVLVSVQAAAGEVDSRARTLAAEADGAARQLTELEVQLEEARQKALIDELTGLQNRRALEMALDNATGEGHARGPWCFLLVDIDNFRIINDTHGRVVGDALLYKVGRVVAEALPASAGDSTAGRYGGEEFGILARGSTAQGARLLGERIRESVSAAKWAVRSSTDLVLRSTVSVGIAEYQSGDLPESVVWRAFAALRKAKAGGRNAVALEQSAISSTLAARQAAFRGRQ